jgi:hypothetical protein
MTEEPRAWKVRTRGSEAEVDGAISPSTVTNSGLLREPADKQSIYAIKQGMHQVWEYFHARLAFTMAAFHVLVQWHGFQPYASGCVPLSMAEVSL